MSWFGFSLLALGLWGIWGFLSKVATQYLPSSAVYLLAITGNLAVIGYLGLTGSLAIPWHPVGLGLAITAGVCMAFGLLSFFTGPGRRARLRGGAPHRPVSGNDGGPQLGRAA